MYHKCLVIQENSLGMENPETAITYHAIGSILHSKGQCDEALEIFLGCLVIQENSLGTEHSLTK